MVANDGKLSLREAVAQANATAGADTIVFASALEGKTLTLTGGELVLTRDVTIDGDRNNDGKEVTLSGGDASRILHISGSDTDVGPQGPDPHRRPDDRRCENGGAIRGGLTARALTLDQRRSAATARRANLRRWRRDLQRYSALTLTNSTVSGNSTAGNTPTAAGSPATTRDADQQHGQRQQHGGRHADGGGIFGRGDVTLTNSTVSGNSTAGYDADGGGISGDDADADQQHGQRQQHGGRLRRRRRNLRDSWRRYDRQQHRRRQHRADGSGATTSSARSPSATATTSSAATSTERSSATARASRRACCSPAIDPATGGGLLNPPASCRLRNSVTNPALSGGDPLAALPTDQLGTARPLPAGSLPDIGAAERNQTLSTTRLGQQRRAHRHGRRQHASPAWPAPT